MKALLLMALAAVAFAQPKIENARLESRAVNGALDATFRSIVASSADPGWIGYSVPQIPGERSTCGTVSLEGAREFVILFRVAAAQVEKIRTYATDCVFDAGGLSLHWLAGVDGAQSAMLLSTFIPPASNDDRKGLPWQLANSALSAIARHQDGAPALIDLARRPQISSQMRQEAVRWLGRSKDPRAEKFFEQILATR